MLPQKGGNAIRVHMREKKYTVKAIEEDANKKISHVHESEELILSILFEAIYSSTQSLPKFQWHFSQKYNNPKIFMRPQKDPHIAKTFLKKKKKTNKAGGIILG